jgi:hypothetical protein
LNREVATLELRGCDTVLLEAQLPEILRRPMGQIAPVNVMDLVELAATDGRPKTTDRALQRFVAELPRQLADIPRGKSWETFLVDLEELPGDRVPHVYRRLVEAEAKTRTDTWPRVEALLAQWASAEPAPFVMNARHVRVQRATMAEPKPEVSRAERATRAPKEPREPGTRAPKAPKEPKAERTAVVVDIERRDFVIQQALERLGRTTSDKGLLEAVLLAGIKHAAKDRYPDMIPGEILAILRQLKDHNRVKYSAGRWMQR